MFGLSGIFPAVFILLLAQPNSHGHKTGAPILSCSTMIPGHGVRPQSTPPPYTIKVTPLNGGRFRIKLDSTKDYFTGFMLRPKLSPKLAGASEDFSGTFVDVPEGSSILNCGGEKASAVTHSNPDKKKSVEFDWQSPPNYSGSMTVVGTVVHNYTTFWTGVQSLPVQITNSGGNNNNPLNAALLSVYEGCGSTKNCVTDSEDCLRNKNCNGVASIRLDSGAYQVEMFARSAKYVAIGFSEDAAMGGDNVFECTDENGKVEPHRSWNVPNRKENQRLDDLTGINLVNGLVADGTIYCKIIIQPVTTNNGEKFDLNNERFFLLLAAGSKLHPANRPGVGFHDLFAAHSKTSYLLSEVGSESSRDSFYDGCGSTKTCFGVPDDCVDKQNCRIVTAVTVQGNRFVISMQAKDAKYVATGFSEDRLMKEDTVVECVDNGTVRAYQSWNVPNRKDNIRENPNELEKLSGSITDNILRCTVVFDPKNTKSFRYDQKYYLLLAAGTNLRTNGIARHNLAAHASEDQVSLPSEQKTTSFYTGCDRTKACFGNAPDCVRSESCIFAAAVSADFNNKYTFHLMGERSPAYVAVGLSTDTAMGDDLVFECVQDPQSNQVRSYMSWNIATPSKSNYRLTDNKSQLINGSLVDGKLQCVITIDTPTFTANNRKFNLVQDKYYLMVAAGSQVDPPTSDSIGKIRYHDIGRAVAGESRALADVSVIKAASRLLVVLHGSFMVVAWIGLASSGIVLARYYKQTWTTGTCFGKDIWFFWHRLSMFSAVILTLAGSTMIYLHVGGLITGSPGATHMWFGFATVTLAVLQPIGAFFRPHPGTSRRPIFNWLHWLAGNSAHILSIVTIFLAVDLPKAELPEWTNYVLALFVAYYVIYHLLLSFLGWRSDSSGSGSINEIQLKNINPPRNMPPAYEREKDSPYSGARKFFFCLHLIIIAGICLLIVLLIAKGNSVA